MEKNYNFKFNLEEPDGDAIKKHMDFDALLGQFEQEQVPRKRQARLRRLTYAISAAAAALVLLLFVPGLFQKAALTPEDYFASQDFVNVPLPEMNITYEVKTVADAHRGGVIDYESGSRLVIPAAAFMNDRGKLIGGEVEIHYRELHDYIDFFVSGIPMAYDSLGMQRYLTSAGMVEVFAKQNGRRLRLAPGKAVQVELRSEVRVQDYFTLPNYYVYRLDTVKRSWEYQNIDMLQFAEEEEWEPGAATDSPQRRWQQELRWLEQDYELALQELQASNPVPAAPVPPRQAAGNRPTLELDFVNGELPLDPTSEIQAADLAYLHGGTIWEILPESPEVDSRAFKVEWQQVKLRRINPRQYELTLQHSQNEETLLVAPVLFGEDYQGALRQFEQAQAAYTAKVEVRERQISEARDSLQAMFAERKAALQESLSEELSSRPGPLRRKVINRFVVTNFGIWNCARPTSAPQTMTGVNYVLENGEAIENTTTYVVNETQNTIFRYLASSSAPLGIVADTDNLLWVVNGAGGISVARLDQPFLDGGDLVFKTVTPPVQNQSELRAALSFE
ncbi:MAG: hypothetical protein AAFO02_19375 [Bacteroidota bacterium]